MARVLTVAGTALTSTMKLDSFMVGGQASFGASHMDSFIVYDDANTSFGTAEHWIRTQYSLTEDASGTAVYLGRGRITTFESHRGDDDSVFGTEIQLTFEGEDANSELSGIDVDAWDRPAETDYERVTALGTAYLNGSPRASTNLDTTTYVPNTNTVDLPAKVYYDADPQSVMEDIAGQSDNKIFFVTSDHELYYDQQDSATYAAGLQISDGIGDAPTIDNATYFAPIWDQGAALHWDGQNYASRIRYSYGGGSSILVTDASSEALHDMWVGHLSDADNLSAAAGSAFANQELLLRAYTTRTYQVTVKLQASQTDLVKWGQSIWIYAQAATDSAALGIAGLGIRRRIAELVWEPIGQGWYYAHMNLDQPLKKAPRSNARGTKPSDIPHPAPPSPTPSGGTALWSVDYASGDDSWTEPCGSTSANFTGPWTSALHSCSSMAGARPFDGIYTFPWIPASDNELTLQLRIARRGAELGSNSIVYIQYNDGATCSSVGWSADETVVVSPVGYGFADNCATNSWSDKVIILTPPAGTTMIRLRFSFDGAIQSGSLTRTPPPRTPTPTPSTIRGPARTSRAATTRASPPATTDAQHLQDHPPADQ